MAIPAMQYGPYWKSSRRSEETQKRALGLPGMTPEQIAAERYGELSAYLGDARSRTQQAFTNNLALVNQRNVQRQQKSQEQGYKVGGLATLGSLGVKLLESQPIRKAFTGLWKTAFPGQSDQGSQAVFQGDEGMAGRGQIIEMLPDATGAYEPDFMGAEGAEYEGSYNAPDFMGGGIKETNLAPPKIVPIQSSFLGDDFDFSWLF